MKFISVLAFAAVATQGRMFTQMDASASVSVEASQNGTDVNGTEWTPTPVPTPAPTPMSEELKKAEKGLEEAVSQTLTETESGMTANVTAMEETHTDQHAYGTAISEAEKNYNKLSDGEMHESQGHLDRLGEPSPPMTEEQKEHQAPHNGMDGAPALSEVLVPGDVSGANDPNSDGGSPLVAPKNPDGSENSTNVDVTPPVKYPELKPVGEKGQTREERDVNGDGMVRTTNDSTPVETGVPGQLGYTSSIFTEASTIGTDGGDGKDLATPLAYPGDVMPDIIKRAAAAGVAFINAEPASSGLDYELVRIISASSEQSNTRTAVGTNYNLTLQLRKKGSMELELHVVVLHDDDPEPDHHSYVMINHWLTRLQYSAATAAVKQ